LRVCFFMNFADFFLTYNDNEISLEIMAVLNGSSVCVGEAYGRRIRSVRVRALRLLDQQLWCLGRDVCEHGNLLMRYGMTRRRPPDAGAGSSEYAWDDGAGFRVTFWAYGVHVMRAGEAGVFLKRYAFAPRLTRPGAAPRGCWQVQAWKRARAPRTTEDMRLACARLAALGEWCARYEAWVTAEVGVDYRNDCLQRWHKEALTPPDAIADEWEKIQRHFSE